MSDILMSDTGDISISNGNLSLTSGLQATSQRLRQKLRLFLAEWFLDEARGIPYNTQIFIKKFNPLVVDAIFKKEIINDPAVLELQEYILDLETTTRFLTVTFKALTTDGPIDFTETVVI